MHHTLRWLTQLIHVIIDKILVAPHPSTSNKVNTALSLQKLVIARINLEKYQQHDHQKYCVECKFQRTLQELLDKSKT